MINPEVVVESGYRSRRDTHWGCTNEVPVVIFWQNLEYRNESRLLSDWPLYKQTRDFSPAAMISHFVASSLSKASACS